MAEGIRFKNLPSLLNDMKRKKWYIDSFIFEYKKIEYIVILKLFKENQRKPNKHAQAKIEFVQINNTSKCLEGFVDFYEVRFLSKLDFCEFFGIKEGDADRDLFVDFANIFADFIPTIKVIQKDDIQSRLVGSRAEGNNPKAIYCYDVRRNGTKSDGTPHKRTIENSNKAEVLRPTLYERYYTDDNLSFFFSDKEEDNKSDDEIMRAVAQR
ncbi:DUF6037 family protein [Virgibacillus salarius]|uniref:DUF6037 family protein n=1 Tax=Virgibacillus salarius TaxID=447199 RepID=UPI0031DDCA6D